ncbi:MAG: tetratricopeptide repeat protein, partial [Acetobacteraceae bacterium]|nr:tetratricopeptide repeat protein [Acetobacteraceae bacterium]
LAAILAADVAGYSRLIGADEGGTLERLKALRRELIDPKIAEHRGRLVKTTGDGLLVEFASVVDALRCAVEVQREIARRNAGVPDDIRIELRIGINVGDVVVEDGDIFGDGVNVAARLEGLAQPGGICVAARVQEDAVGKLDLPFEDIGEQQLKNIARPIRAYRVITSARPVAPQVSTSLPLPDKPSIAVLPFANMSGDPEQEYFADGMVEEITTALSKLRWFFVIARNSAFVYKGRAVDVKQVGCELGVRYVLEGSVRRGGSRLRITAQLVDAVTGNHVWAERYDRDLADIFAVQDQITEHVVAAIEPELYAAEYLRSQRNPPQSLDAWECITRALAYVGQSTRAGGDEAEALCRRAIAIAPDYGQAHSLLAWVILRRTALSQLDAVLPEATVEARTALRLDERDHWAHIVQGSVLFRMRRHEEAERSYRRALECNPNAALAHAVLGYALAAQGKYEEAIGNAERALRLSPGNSLPEAQATHVIVFARFGTREYVASETAAREMLERYPEYLPAYYVLIAASAMQGKVDAAAIALADVLRLQPELSLAWFQKNMPWVGEIGERLFQGWRKAGVPEQ